jgi:hypothetical protein
VRSSVLFSQSTHHAEQDQLSTEKSFKRIEINVKEILSGGQKKIT